MKTKITSLLVLIASVYSLRAQIPNASFENWTGNEPNQWITYNSIYPGLATQITDPHAGSKAVKLNVISAFGSNVGGTLFSGTNSSQVYFPVSSAPAALHGWYKFHSSVATEEFIILGLVKAMGTATGSAAVGITANASVYTEFIANYNYSGAHAADSAYLYIVLSEPDSIRWGTYLIIDDLSFGPAGPTGVEELSNSNLLEPCSPNPSSGVSNVIYRVTGNSKVSLALFDVIGNKVKALLDELDQTPGRYKIPTDVSELADGIYFYRLDVNGQSYTQKLVVSKMNR